MPFAPQASDQKITISTIGGLCTEPSPTDVPAGLSPYNREMKYLPGSGSMRDGFHKVFATPMGNVTVTGGDSYIDPLGVIRTLFLDTAGNLWVENVTSSPGILTLLTTTTPNSYMKSLTANGRQYIAISDGLHGTDIPLQYDGTNLDRVTQDGPGAPPAIANLQLPAVAMVAGTGGVTITSVECDPAGPDGSGYFTHINAFTSSSVVGLNIGDTVAISGLSGGAAAMNGTWGPVTGIFTSGGNSLIQIAAYIPPGTVFGLGGTITTVGLTTAIRQSNVVTINTATPHQMQVGYRAQTTGLPAWVVGGGIASIVVNNEDLSGIATVTMTTPHGLIPGNQVTISDVAGVAVGGGISSIVCQGQVVTVTTVSAHGLTPSSSVNIASTGVALDTTAAIVVAVVSPTVFTYTFNSTNLSAATGTVTLNWPIPDTATPEYYEVLEAPTDVSFQVQLNYADGTWSSGVVSFAWDGTFDVSTTPSTTQFQYQQNGPDATSTTVGTVTPSGQVAPGLKQVQVIFQTRNGYTTAPSPPASIEANGGQYLSVTNIPIGPANVIARILAFTGAGGAFFFYIPSQPQVNGQIVGTSTVINDNTTTSAVLDFSDNTLFAGLGIDIQGNNLREQIIIEGALSFAYYASRLMTFGQRNIVQRLLGMGFDSGSFPTTPTLPTGWDATLNTGGALATGHYGEGWQIAVTTGANRGTLSQSFYLDYRGAPLGIQGTQYKIRVWLKTSSASANLSFKVSLTSAVTSFSSIATISGSAMSTVGSFVEAAFTLKTPSPIPSDILLSIYAVSVSGTFTLLVDELSIIYADTPYLDNIIYDSYFNNPEAFDGVSGKNGPSDTHKIMGLAELRGNLQCLTRDPGGHLHETADNGITEPSGWKWDQIGTECGLVSALGLTVSRADEQTGTGGEEWMAWVSSAGARIFGGGEPYKISQEIQPDWDLITPANALSCWALNDPQSRVIFFGLPQGSVTPNAIYPVTYKGLESAQSIAFADPLRVGGENGRKWTAWARSVNGMSLVYRSPGNLQPILFAGNGLALGSGTGFGNVYTMDPAKLTDDDYGVIAPVYVTYFMERDSRLRALLAALSAQVSGVGNLTITALLNRLNKQSSFACLRQLAIQPDFDLTWANGNAQANRIALKFASAPAAGTDNDLSIQSITSWIRDARMGFRGSAS